MKLWLLGLLLGLTLVVAGWPASATLAAPPAEEGLAPGSILVRPRPGRSAVEAAVAAYRRGGQSAAALPDLGVVRLRVPRGEERARAAALAQDPAFLWAQPEHRLRVALMPNDPLYAQQWAPPLIRLPDAWDRVPAASTAAVTLAVVDTGIDGSHPELAGRVLAGKAFLSSDTIQCTGQYNLDLPAGAPSDKYGHGTHVAGIAAAAGNNGQGVAGLAWQAKLLPIKVLDDNGFGCDADVALGVRWAADQGAKVINLSLAGDPTSVFPTVLQEAMDYAHDVKGALVVVAAGNQHRDVRGTAAADYCGPKDSQGRPFDQYGPTYPANLAKVVTVAATDTGDLPASFSNCGKIDLAAPGVSILSTTPTYPVAHTPLSYGYLSGTSMATPMVSGLAALVLSLSPSLPPDAVLDILKRSAKDLGLPGADTSFGAGRIDALGAVSPLLSLSPGSRTLLFGPSTPTQTVHVAVRNRGVGSFSWSASIPTEASSLVSVSGTSSPVSYSAPADLVLTVPRPGQNGVRQIPIRVVASGGGVLDSPQTFTLVVSAVDVLRTSHVPLVLSIVDTSTMAPPQPPG